MPKKIDTAGLKHFKDKENAMVASEFSASKSYAIGEYVYYKGTLYKFKAAHAAGAWTTADVDAVKLADDVSVLKESTNAIVNGTYNFTRITKNDEGVTSTPGYISTSGDIASASSGGYMTCIFPITEDCVVYPSVQTTFCRFAVYSSANISSQTLIRYYTTPDTPTINNPLAVEAGNFVGVSYRPYSDDKYCNLYVASGMDYSLKPTLPLTDEMKSEVNKKRPFYNFEKIESVIGVSHMGYHSNAPENTIPAFRLSKRNGFDMVECDIGFTSDNIPIIMHDSTINRTCCNAIDGSEIIDTIYVNNVTYADLQNYDACTPGKWNVYKGTKIPKFEELLALCKCLGLYIYIDCKSLTDSTKIQTLIDLANNYGMKYSVIFGFNGITGITAAVGCDNTICVSCYENTLVTSYITQLSALLSGNNKIAFFAYTIENSKITDCINARLMVGFIAPTSNEAQALDNLDKRVKFVTGNINATQYLYDNNIGDAATGLLT